ncbi:MAG: hypothetical protein HC888_01890 [Candidatus Competibacteraceae bacterium]|nr:hypothetical protein [Candidatus Competibacteraceae bacterium]
MAGRAVGVDPGTMFFQVAEREPDGTISTKSTRNAFVELEASADVEDILNSNKWQFIKDGNNFYVIGEDAMKVANILPGKVELRRPLQDGVLNSGEEKKILILQQLAKGGLGEPSKDGKNIVCFCVSSLSADGSVDSASHKARLMGLFKSLGWTPYVIDEAYAVVLSENPKIIEDGIEIPLSGIGLSCGAGRTNIVLSYKGLQLIGASCARGGDWIDKKVHESTDKPLSVITRAKETRLDFGNIDFDDDIIFALDVYYGEMIKFVFSKFSHAFKQLEKESIQSPIPVIIAGGTSMPKGFCKKVEEVVKELDLPFEISEIRHAAEPRDAVVKGCMTQAIRVKKKLDKDDDLSSVAG